LVSLILKLASTEVNAARESRVLHKGGKNVLKTDRLTKPLSAKGLQSVDSLFRD